MEHTDLFKYTEQFPEAFTNAETFDAFAAQLDGSKPGPGKLLQHIAAKYPGSWDASYRTIKKHGFTAKPLLLPEATKARDIFADVGLYPYQCGCYRHEVEYVRAGAAFVSGRRADRAAKDTGFDYFGRLGASYVRNGKPYISGGKQVLTAAKPTDAVKSVYSDAGAGEWNLASFEAITWEDGRTLITVRATNGFVERWLCILDPGETAFALLPERDRMAIAAEIEVERCQHAELVSES